MVAHQQPTITVLTAAQGWQDECTEVNVRTGNYRYICTVFYADPPAAAAPATPSPSAPSAPVP